MEKKKLGSPCLELKMPEVLHNVNQGLTQGPVKIDQVCILR